MAKIYLSDKQVNLVVHNYITEAMKAQKVVSLYAVNTLKDFITGNMQDALLLFPGYRAEANKVIDVDMHNENIEMLKLDMRAFNETIVDVYNKIRQLNTNFDILSDFYGSQIIYTQNQILNIKSNLLSEELAFIEDFSSNENINQEKTTAFINSDTQLATIEQAIPRDYINVDEIEEDTIKVICEADTMERFYWRGSRTSIFDYINPDVLRMVVINKERENVTASLIIPLDKDREPRNVNKIVVQMENAVGMLCSMEGSRDGVEYIELSADYLLPNKNAFELIHEQTDLRYIRINLVKSTEDYNRTVFLEYHFPIMSIGLNSTNFAINSMVVSNKIQKEIDGEIISPAGITMEVDDNIPDGCDIDYEVSADGIAWKPITPSNKEKAANNLISFRTAGTLLIDNIVPLTSALWSDAKPVQRTGINKLYSLLQFGAETGNYDFCQLIEDPVTGQTVNKITVEGKSVIKDTVSVRRGKNDYSIVDSDSPIEVEILDMQHEFHKDDRYVTDFVIKVVDERATTDANSKFQTRYPAYTKMPIDVEVDNQVIEPDNVAHHDMFLVSKPHRNVRVTYYVTLRDYEIVTGFPAVIDEASVQVADVITGDLFDRRNFVINTNDKKISLRSGSSLSSDNLNQDKVTVTINYNYETVRDVKAALYQTFVEVNQDVAIRIFPFEPDEVDGYGNFHMIDGVDVSFNTSFMLRQGKHQIISTNPHKTDPGNANDVNILTKRNSNAGIYIDPNQVKSMYAYELPQRRTTTFNLSNVVKSTDHRSFCVEVDENGDAIILLNYQPLHLLRDIVELSPSRNQVRGEELYGKRVIYDSLWRFVRYDVLPETFTVKFNVKSDDVQDIDGVYYRAILNRSEIISTKTPVLNKVKVNFIGG